MDFVVAIKTEPNRIVREISRNNIIVLMSKNEQVADKDILHRDRAYLKKLEGVCFECSKLNAQPPQDVCEVPEPEDPPPHGCPDYNNPCSCFDCPEPPTGNCITGYPLRNAPDLGSGYWIGLNANAFYSNPIGGGWLVAVSCTSGDIVGAFPVSNANFGYGRGTILTEPVMVYPAGAVKGAGIEPQNRTTFPILGLIPSDGNAIISAGSFNILTANTPIGNPTSNPSYFCVAANSFVVSMPAPRPCLVKYGNSECADFKFFPVQGTTPEYQENSYLLNIKNVSNFPTGLTGETVVVFENNLGTYSSVVNFTRAASDALSGSCGGNVWPDIAIGGCASCENCNPAVPCQYLANLTNGNFDSNYYGYTAAANGINSFVAIGPSNPPVKNESGTLSNTEFWEDWWGWDQTESYVDNIIFSFGNGTPTPFVIPPIKTLNSECSCGLQLTSIQTIHYIDQFPVCCVEGGIQGSPTPTILTSRVSSATCASECTTCISNACISGVQRAGPTSIETVPAEGKSGRYSYTPCHNCNGDPEPQFKDTAGLWYLSEGTGDNIAYLNNSAGEGGSIPPPDPLNKSCQNILFAYSAATACSNPCTAVMYDQNGVYGIDELALINCAGVNLNGINSDCFKAKFLPQIYQNYQLRLKTPDVNNEFYISNELVANIEILIDGTWRNLKTELYGPDTSTNYWYKNNFGPLGPMKNISGKCSDPFLSAFEACAVPFTNIHQFIVNPECDPSGGDYAWIETKGIARVRNELCKECVNGQLQSSLNATDPCSCCSQSANGEGILECTGGNCPPECEGSGCVTGVIPEGIIITNATGSC